ncbi:hypothetical protein K466DRAFT_604939 [Polyporus arcularius HHB13444]|uniref:F-box domain-containing protein n=1 Tax=Polyporus arcularius HHB13444 TaxID=1314778 RepID=A0A5C3NWK1_9APHY|nr:hypothetical protein K466DRAFT_604939 [Polyporus arcularius HHB13444]
MSIGLVTLASLARTSRALHEPAAEVLWRWIPNVSLLFYTLPHGCYRSETLKGRHCATTFEITRQLEAEDLVRYQLYAKRVTHVGVSEDDRMAGSAPCCPSKVLGYVASLKALQELARVARVNGWRLLPNLTTLVIDEMLSDFIASQLQHLSGPSLREVRFEVYPPPRACEVDEPDVALETVEGAEGVTATPVEGEEGVTAMLAALLPIARQLKKLDIEDMHPNTPPVVTALWGLIISCRNLASVRVDCDFLSITPAALCHIARLPFLQQLSFGSTDGAFTVQDIADFDRLPRSETFPQLRAVDRMCVGIDLAMTVITHISSPFLQGLEIEIFRTPLPHAFVTDLLHSFRRLPNISALIWLHMRYDSPGPAAGPDTITPRSLLPFLASAHIVSFEILVGCPFDLDDAFIVDMVHAWPDLESLRLGGFYPYKQDYTPKVTWDGIITMARGWRELKELSIYFDSDVSRASPSKLKELWQSNRANGTKERRTLDSMDVGFSKIHDEMAIAALLSELFTPIGEIQSSWNDLIEAEETEEQLRMEEEGDAFQRDPQLAARAALYGAYYHRWCWIEDHMAHMDMIRCQEERWRSARYAHMRAPTLAVSQLGYNDCLVKPSRIRPDANAPASAPPSLRPRTTPLRSRTSFKDAATREQDTTETHEDCCIRDVLLQGHDLRPNTTPSIKPDSVAFSVELCLHFVIRT